MLRRPPRAITATPEASQAFDRDRPQTSGELPRVHDAPFEGIRIIECSILGPGALTTHLVDLGADEIKIEPPGGDYVRQMTWPIIDGVSLMHLHINRGKPSLVVDLRRLSRTIPNPKNGSPGHPSTTSAPPCFRRRSRFADTTLPRPTRAPAAGQHTTDVLRSVLDFDSTRAILN